MICSACFQTQVWIFHSILVRKSSAPICQYDDDDAKSGSGIKSMHMDATVWKIT